MITSWKNIYRTKITGCKFVIDHKVRLDSTCGVKFSKLSELFLLSGFYF